MSARSFLVFPQEQPLPQGPLFSARAAFSTRAPLFRECSFFSIRAAAFSGKSCLVSQQEPPRLQLRTAAARALARLCGRRKSIPKCRVSQKVPPPGSYRLRRHFPRLCNLLTQVRHPYRARSLRDERLAIRCLRCRLANHEPAVSQGFDTFKTRPSSSKGRRKSTISNFESWNHEFVRRERNPPPANGSTNLPW